MWFKSLRRQRLLAQPFPEGWEAILLRNVAHYRLLNEEEQAQLRQDARILVAEKYWEGCRGVQITDEIKVTIAAQAALMLLGLEHDYFRRVLTILVYPSEFMLRDDESTDEHDEGRALTGQAFYRGPVILAWDSVLAEGRDPSSGHSLVIHEFAHQLDFLDDSVNGTPILQTPEQAQRWHDVMTAEYSRLQEDSDRGLETFLGDYAATNETEFFSVASERFFTLPAELRDHHAGALRCSC